MPPKAKTTKEAIVAAALDLTRREGFAAVNARSLAAALQCSTRPLFTCYKNMEELKADLQQAAYAFYERYVAAYQADCTASPCLVLPLSYLAFAREETALFRYLFISDLQLDMARTEDFYREPGNEAKARAFAEALGVEPARGRAIFLDLFFYAHGMAVLTAEGRLELPQADAERLLAGLLTALVRQVRPGWNGCGLEEKEEQDGKRPVSDGVL